MLRFLKLSTRSGDFKNCSSLTLRCLSTECELAEKVNGKILKPKRFTKPHSVRKSAPFRDNFFNNLFLGILDKEIFKYPSVLQNEEITAMLKHSIEVEEYLKNSVKPNAELTKDLIRDLDKAELLGLSVPQNYGGLGYTETETKFIQECTGVNQKIARLLVHNGDNVTKLLTLFGSEEQKQKYLPRLAGGEILGTLAYLENPPLIEIASYTAIAVENKIKDGYMISGKKKWVHNANIADLIIVFTKSSSIVDDDRFQVNYNLFIVEKNSPGVTVHGLKSSRAQEFDLYEVDFENVFVPSSNLLGAKDNAYSMIKVALSHSQLGSATLCLALVKKMIYSLIQVSEEKVVDSKAVTQSEMVQTNMGLLTTLAYALESTVYCIASRFDLYEEPDLFVESCIAKVFAVETLQKAIQIYTQILGFDSLKSSGLLDEALKVWQYHLTLDENNIYLKLLIGSSGVLHASGLLANQTKKFRQGYNHPMETFKWFFYTSDKKISARKSKYNFKMELHGALASKAEMLETSLAKLEVTVQEFLFWFGNRVPEEETMLVKLGEMATYIYLFTVCLARASNSYCNNSPESSLDIGISQSFADFANMEIDQLNEILRKHHRFETVKQIGNRAFRNKEYPAVHPLIRAY